MGQALYRTYRSKKLSEIVGQEHITTALARALKKGTISHAYLFTGPRGTGKTSIARILAHEINNLPYTDESQHLDIIEIDAASNRRIDEIRDLRDKVFTAPASARYKVYIIDEVHMLTKEAFNALLKTLEEPPAHVVFILATTEMHKLPETIVSRTQRFAFKPVELSKVTAHLRTIAGKEKITIDDEALTLIAAHGGGSFRDSISLLDQARHTGEAVTAQTVQAMLGLPSEERIAALIGALRSQDPSLVVNTLGEITEQGVEPVQIAKELGKVLRGMFLSKDLPFPSLSVAFDLLERLVQVPASPSPGISLEVALLQAATSSDNHSGTQPPAPKHAAHPVAAAPSVSKAVEKSKPAAPQSPPAPAPASTLKPVPEAAETKEKAPPASTATLDAASWQEVLKQLKTRHSTLYTAAKTAAPSFSPGTVTLAFSNRFNQKRCNDKRNKEIIFEAVHGVVGQDITVSCIYDEHAGAAPLPPAPSEAIHTVSASAPEPATKPAAPPSAAVSAISNIFGGAEVLES